MKPDRCGRLKWIEVLVIIIVVGFLLALLLPAVNHQPPGRRAWCMNNQRQFGLALLNYEAAHKQFPGYTNRIAKRSGGTWLHGSWVVSIFEFLERADLDSEWRRGNPIVMTMGFTTCPSDPRERQHTEPWLAYVVNCGLPGDSDTGVTGVFHNHTADDPMHVSIPYLAEHDGAQNTLLLSENCQGGMWTDTEEADVGMVWFRRPEDGLAVNQGRDDVDLRPHDIRFARPSSRHRGGVIATFCDGHSQFLSETIDYTVYQQLMAPDDKAAGLPGGFDPATLDNAR